MIGVLELNRESIDGIVAQYQPGHNLNLFKGMRKTIPADLYPSLELEPSSGAMNWEALQVQNGTYSIEMMLTICTNNDAMSVEYIGTLTKQLTGLLNNPTNFAFLIPNEVSYLPNRGYGYTQVQFAAVESVTYNSNKEGTIRIAQWEWYCKILEAFQESAYDNVPLKKTVLNPVILPPIPDNPYE